MGWDFENAVSSKRRRVVRLSFPVGFPLFVVACFGFVSWEDENWFWLVGPFRAIPSSLSPDDAAPGQTTPLPSFLPTSRKEIDRDFATLAFPHVAHFMPRPRFQPFWQNVSRWA